MGELSLKTEDLEYYPLNKEFKSSDLDAEIFALSPIPSTVGNADDKSSITSQSSPRHDEFIFLHAFELGYTPYELDRLTCYVPQSIASTLKELLQLLREQNMKRISYLKTVHAFGTTANNFPQDPQNYHSKVQIPCLLDDSGPHALLRASYDPSTHRATRVDLNRRMADLLGLSLESAPYLLAARGLTESMPVWDCLCAFVDAMLHLSTSSVVRYFRFCSSHRRPCRAALVSGTISKNFNAVGEVIEVPATLPSCPDFF